MTARLTVVLEDESLYRKLKVRAAEEGVAMKQIIHDAVAAYLDGATATPESKYFDWDEFARFQERIEKLDAENPEPSPTDLSDIKHHLYGYPKSTLDERAWRKLAEERTEYDSH